MQSEYNGQQLSLGTALAVARRAQNMSQQMLARRCGIHNSWLSQIERDMELPGLALLLRLVAALDLECTIALRSTAPNERKQQHDSQTPPD